tara:strand:+ start:328 stop:1800 length:1473 start_codon:yes stop_codon:yes gene_type:complete
MRKVTLSANQKALSLNLDPNIYGTFSEIGAGQEVVRHFFRCGGASGTIAKAMSAYDMDVSDAIYGKEDDKRYVCESRLKKMLSREYLLLEERLSRKKHPTKTFFSFANTIATTKYNNKTPGHGWMGIKFQTKAREKSSEIILHLRLHDREARTQQECVGILGANLMYASFNFHNDPKKLINSLYDSISKDQLEIDMVQMNGELFSHIDNRLLSLYLVKNKMTEAVIFSPEGNSLQPSDILHKKNILAIRGSFRPVTKVNIDMIKTGYNLFKKEKKVNEKDLQVLFEITLNNLATKKKQAINKNNNLENINVKAIKDQDFLDRVDVLCSIGQTVLISNYGRYYKLLDYFSRFTDKRMGIILGVMNLKDIFDYHYYDHLDGGILEGIGKMFNNDSKVYVYPYKENINSDFINSKNLKIHKKVKTIYDYYISTKRIIDIENFDTNVLSIFSHKVLHMIRNNKIGWEKMVPNYVDNLIKENNLFNFRKKSKKTK